MSSVHTPNEGRQWRYLAYRMTNLLTDCTTAVSQDAIDTATRRGAAPRDGIRLIGNGIDTDEFRPDPGIAQRLRSELGLGDAFTWLAVGRMTPAKAYPGMVSAFANLLGSHPDARLLIAGSGEEDVEAPVAARVPRRAWGSPVAARLPRRRPRPHAGGGRIPLSSAWEGLPMVLLEAAASELPIVATRVGGNEDAVTDGVSGLLVPPGDPSALADAMRDVMASDDGRAARDGPGGSRARPGGFDLDATIDIWLALYAELLGPQGHRGADTRASPAAPDGGRSAGDRGQWLRTRPVVRDPVRRTGRAAPSASGRADGSRSWRRSRLLGHALEAGPDARRDHDQRVVVGAEEPLHQRARASASPSRSSYSTSLIRPPMQA